MSKPKVFEKPLGVKDYLPEAVTKLRNIEYRVLACMERWGYNQIITPTLEYYDTVGVASSTEDKKLFKLLDRKGKTLVLRSELTAPIARVASSLLKEHAFPLRLSYHSNVFRAIEEEAGRDSEFFQTGVELVGDASSDADAEVVALAIASLQAAGVNTFKIALGHVGFLNGLFQETLEGRNDAQLTLKEHLLSRDYVGYREAIKSLALTPEVERELGGVLRLRGGDEICEQARMVSQHPIAQDAIRHLCEVWDVLQAYGVSEHVVIDLTMIGDFSYYTGMTFEGYAADLGFPVCSGGRYDNLLSQFGRPAPATGFALKTNRILEVTGKENVEQPGRVLIAYDAEHREEALQLAKAMRSSDDEVVIITHLVHEHEAWSTDLLKRDDGQYELRGTVYDDVITLIA
ncbi:ATP phosphoribosyltransferase regulatory subunit [Paenibacillus sp. yr247]|uniref:ATP phosphoribosyltransferase regulatory subunit n=1 Tax=Paenibacillus sp. yr247 TaxID=1761880 RepID=UPI000880559B|nr:ATP phosphoribosyltransferase regulatory subunit [Paenibacillus sp. yr247]SDO70928.1 ATP phosphoribosyltransferase regulatory subunit [Paenibacillus sp. yr247]